MLGLKVWPPFPTAMVFVMGADVVVDADSVLAAEEFVEIVEEWVVAAEVSEAVEVVSYCCPRASWSKAT
jgi:hypothetical protein